MQNHESGYDVPRCHYYNNQKECPYFKVGCMYKHEKSGKCKAFICTRQMCQFEHEEKMDVEEQVEGLSGEQNEIQVDEVEEEEAQV